MRSEQEIKERIAKGKKYMDETKNNQYALYERRMVAGELIALEWVLNLPKFNY